eukprot:TRINITY_DN311_c0_g1_i3.p1 TRINITY_DN311_c0_g1~~TRINITY_DN311_c0_g1_i3.p1  ORF type:complete len:496 (+),score=87.81 TRINITY_DN311_c0_g1_i3:405-1892(+)
MEITYVYTKKRAKFGRHVVFRDKPAELLFDITPSKEVADEFIERDPNFVEVQAVPDMSEHEIVTEKFATQSQGVLHLEGGWPKDIDPSEAESTIRYRRKVEKSDEYARSVKALGVVVEDVIQQNNALDIYEEYFSGEPINFSSEPPSVKTLTCLRDPSPLRRTASSISWHPDGSRKLAISYSVLQFQEMPDGLPLHSYIWDIENPNYPEQEITPVSPLVSLRYNPKESHFLVGGSYNGVIAYWDTRKGPQPIDSTPIEKSHRDPVYDVEWIQSKTGSECFSVSTDGQVFWWDVRKLGEPTDSMQLDWKGDNLTYGGIVLEYDPALPTRFMVGTEQGIALSCNRKSKTPAERIMAQYPGHHGPVYALQKNPFFPKHFLTVGDWSVRIWNEDIRTPIMSSKYHMAYTTDGCWSPTRPGVFFTTKLDGTLDIWDCVYNQNDPALSLKVCDAGLHTMAIQDQGKFIAIGAKDGSTTMVQLCESLYVSQASEKQAVSNVR